MATTLTHSNHFYYQLGKKEIDMDLDTFVAILMDSTFVFDPTTHATLSDVSSDQIATGNGYTQDSKTLTGGTWTEDDTNNRAYRNFDGWSWTASGGAIQDTAALIIYDGSSSDDTIVLCLEFGTTYSIVDGSTITFGITAEGRFTVSVGNAA